MVKVRIVQVGKESGQKAARLHLRYLEREGVQRDGSAGALYNENGFVERSAFEKELAGEKHQFRFVLSPEDAHELDLDEYVRTYIERLEADLRQKLRWCAVNHYNTDNPHAHVIIRGVDENGAEVWMDREYVSHGLRHRAAELATERLGPRPERSRVDQLKREAEFERYTSLDRVLERRAEAGIFRPAARTPADPHLEAALRTRLEVLSRLGLASRAQRNEWQLSPQLRPELESMARRAEGLRAIRSVLPLSTNRCRIIDRTEPRDSQRPELDAGVQGVLRWKGLDEQGQFCAVVETTAGTAYYLPISGRVAQQGRVGQVVEIKRAVDKDQKIEEVARKSNWTYDLGAVAEPSRQAYRGRLEHLERMGLAERDPAGPDLWRVRPDFRAQVEEKNKPLAELERAFEKDQKIEEVARKSNWTYDVGAVPQRERDAYRTRLEQLERVKLAERDPAGRDQWRLQPDFRDQLLKSKPQPFWQMLSVRFEDQALDAQKVYEGYVWLDRVRLDQLGLTGFGREVRDALRTRYEYLRGLGVVPQSDHLRWKLLDAQRRRFEQSLAASGGTPVRYRDGLEGTVRVHREKNGERFVEIRCRDGSFAALPAPRDIDGLEGRFARLHVGERGRVRLQAINRDRGLER